MQVGCQQWRVRKRKHLFLPSCGMQGGRNQTSTMFEEGVELILGIWRCCGVVIQGEEAAIQAMFWGKLSWNKEQGKCSLSNRKAVSTDPTDCTDLSSPGTPFRPWIPRHFYGTSRPMLTSPGLIHPEYTSVQCGVLANSVLQELCPCTLSVCSFVCIFLLTGCMLEAWKERDCLSYRILDFSGIKFPSSCIFCSKLPGSHLLVLSPEVKNHLQGNGGAH